MASDDGNITIAKKRREKEKDRMDFEGSRDEKQRDRMNFEDSREEKENDDESSSSEEEITLQEELKIWKKTMNPVYVKEWGELGKTEMDKLKERVWEAAEEILSGDIPYFMMDMVITMAKILMSSTEEEGKKMIVRIGANVAYIVTIILEGRTNIEKDTSKRKMKDICTQTDWKKKGPQVHLQDKEKGTLEEKIESLVNRIEKLEGRREDETTKTTENQNISWSTVVKRKRERRPLRQEERRKNQWE